MSPEALTRAPGLATSSLDDDQAQATAAVPSVPRLSALATEPVANEGGAVRAMAPRAPTPDRAPRGETREATFGLPVLRCSVELRTEQGRRVYHRVWERLKADLYVITVRSRTVGMDEAARTMEAMITEEFDSVRRDIEDEMARADVLRESVKVASSPEYHNIVKQQAEYSTPRAYEFLMLIAQMDTLLQTYDFLWLSGIIDTHARVQRAQNWQRRLIKVANRMRELGNRTRSAATREIERRAQRTVKGSGGAGAPAVAQEHAQPTADGGALPQESGGSAASSEVGSPGSALVADADLREPASGGDDDSDALLVSDGKD